MDKAEICRIIGDNIKNQETGLCAGLKCEDCPIGDLCTIEIHKNDAILLVWFKKNNIASNLDLI